MVDTGPGAESPSGEEEADCQASSDSVAFLKLATHLHFPGIAGSAAGLLSDTLGPESPTLKRQEAVLMVLML